MKKYIPIALALGISTNILISAPEAFSQYEYNMEANYAKYYDQGIQYYNNNEYSKAIEQFEQALKLAPNNSAVRNNLAVSYISRGTYFHNKVSNYETAADNYRDAIYYLKYDTPDGVQDSPNAQGNLDIAEKNLTNALLNLGITGETSYHFKKAKELRAKGQFKGAIVEYFLALDKSPPNAEAYEAIGDMYRVLQNNDRAVTNYQKALNIKKDDTALYVKTGLAYEKTGKLNSAINAFNQASALDPGNMDANNSLEKIWRDQIKLNPRNAAAHANLGTILQKKGDFDGAMQEYNAAELIDPNNVLVRLNLGTLYQAKGDIPTAIKAYDTILTIDPKNVLAHYYKATALKQVKDFDNAIKELNNVLQLDSNNALAKKELAAIAKEKAGGSEQLAEVLKDIADKDPNNASAQYDAAFEAHSKGDLNLAISYYRKTITINPNFKDAYANLGAALMANKDYIEATKVLKKAKEFDPDNQEIEKLLSELENIQTASKYDEALALHQQGKIAEAIPLYEEALKADTNNVEILVNLGAAHQANRNYSSAINSYNKAITIDPNSSLAYYYLGATYHAKNQMNEAILNYKKAIELDNNNNDAKEALKSAQEGQVDSILSDALNSYNGKAYDKARVKIDEALKLDPNNALAFYYLGLILEGQNSLTSAIANYKKATEIDPQLDSAFYALAVAQDKANDKVGAKQSFQKFVQLSGNKDDAFVKYAKERLKQL
ncbi:MAG: tetratricopeptide repeat protein [Cyanobacteriota bacterium]